jgi:hypothetical protein
MLANAVLSITVLLAGASDERNEGEKRAELLRLRIMQQQTVEAAAEVDRAQAKFDFLMHVFLQSNGKPETSAAILRVIRKDYPDSPLGRLVRGCVLP